MGDDLRRVPAESSPGARLTWRRSIRFSAVGTLGIGVQLATLWALAGWLGWHYLAATVAATETAVLHNFVWHMRWTWADRPASAVETFARLGRFHVTNGLVSIVGNALVMMLLTGVLTVHFLLANMASILTCSLANLALSELWVFRHERKRCTPHEALLTGEAGCPRHS